MTTKEDMKKDLLNAIEARMNKIENDIEEMFIAESSNKEIRGILQLKVHIKNKDMMQDLELYNNMRKNELAVMIEPFDTKDLRMTKEVSAISSRALREINIPADVSQKDLQYLLRNSKIQKTLDSVRERLVRMIERKTKEVEKAKEKLVERKQKEEIQRINSAIESAYKISLQGAEIEKKIIDLLNQERKLANKGFSFFGLFKRENINTDAAVNGTQKQMENISELERINNEREELEKQRESLRIQAETLMKQILPRGYSVKEEKPEVRELQRV